MKDRNGIEIRIGDVLRSADDGSVRIVHEIDDAAGDFWEAKRPDGVISGGRWTETSWTIIRRADWGVPTKKEGDEAMAKAIVRRAHGTETLWSCADAKMWEIVARGKGGDLVPESFSPDRDSEGRPVLREKCDGCGAEGVLVPATVRGKPGCICMTCAERCKYPVKEQELRYASGEIAMVGDVVKKDGEYGGQRSGVIVRLHYAPEPSDVLVEWRTGTLAGQKLGTCAARLTLISRAANDDKKPPEPAAEKPQPPDLHSRYEAFDARVREIVAEVAPNTPIATDPVSATAEQAAGMLITFGAYSGRPGNIFDTVFPFDWDVEKVGLEFRDMLWTYLGTVGARAMGKVGAKGRSTEKP